MHERFPIPRHEITVNDFDFVVREIGSAYSDDLDVIAHLSQVDHLLTKGIITPIEAVASVGIFFEQRRHPATEYPDVLQKS
jgi:hypothetical protein